ELLARTGASRVTLRRDVPGEYAFPVTDEALAEGAASLRAERTVDLRTQPVVLELQRGTQVVQDDRRAAYDDPAYQRMLETEDGLAGQLTRESSHADAGRLDLGLAHPLSGPVYVKGAKPGDLLAIEFVAYETANFGVTPVVPGFGFLADLFPEPYVVAWDIDSGLARSPELPGVAVPEATFAGVVGVAPSRARLDELRRRVEALRAG